MVADGKRGAVRKTRKADSCRRPVSSLDDEIAALKLRMQAMESRLERVGSSELYLKDDQALLRDARNAAGWSMKVFAEALGVSANAVCWWENGRMRMPAWRARAIVDMFRRSEVTPPAWPSILDE